MPHADFGPIKVPDGVPDERFLYLSDILPTAWQGVEYADVPEGGTLAVLGLGPGGPARRPRRRRTRASSASSASTGCPSGSPLAAPRGAETVDLERASTTSPTRSAS